MTYYNAQIRSATTAIAAFLALSSTPLVAQDAPAPDPAPETLSEPVTPAPDPLAPEPTSAEPAAAAETASPPAKASARAAKAKVATAKPATISRTTTTRSTTATTTATDADAPAAEAIEAPVAPPAEAVPEPAPTDTASLDEAQQMDTMLEVGGAGLLALLLGGMALRSRRRRKEEERVEEAKWAYIEAHEPEAEVSTGPAFVRTPGPMHDPVPAASATPASAPATKLPNGFDLSRFGPHVQAAYSGPTPDNPSLSLKYRLRRASAMDQQERRVTKEVASTRPAAQAPAKPAWAPREEARFMLRRAGTNNGAKPALQR